jgi:GT2 family glycosyltransferase
MVSASTCVYRREAFEAAGGFDQDYFTYCEDADLCLRMDLLGWRGLYVPEARAYHAWGASTGRASDSARFYSIRNGLTTLLKDMPLGLLLRSLPKIMLYQSYILSSGRGDGYGSTVLRAWGSFLRNVPATLRKRRAVMGRRAIGSREFGGMLLFEYPVETRLHPRRLSRAFRHRIVGPLLRRGGKLLRRVGG